MAKGDVKTPNKRKSFGIDTPGKKAKIENDKSNGIALKKPIQTPTNNQQGNKKFNNKKKPNQVGLPKNISPVAGTKQKQKQPQKTGDSQSPDKKKKRRNQYNSLITNVKGKPGSKDPELLKQLTEKINAIKARPEITKSAKRKLAVLQKLKVICEEGAEVAAAKSQARVAAEKAAASRNKADKKTAPQQAAKGNKNKAAVKVAVKVEEEDSDEEASDAEESGEEEENESGEEDSDAEGEEKTEGDSDEDDDDDEEEDDDDSEEEAPAPQVSKKGKPNKKK